MKPRILFIAPFPPPVHGSAVVSSQIRESAIINSQFDCTFVNLSTSRGIEEVGHFAPAKIFRFLGTFLSVLHQLIWRRFDLCYLAITCYGKSFLKDAPFVLLCKLFGRKVIIHQHNKGMAGYVDKRPYRWLLPLVYRNTRVILLSWRLYPDIAKIVSRSQVVVCPNGMPDVPGALQRNESGQDNRPRLLFLSNLMKSKGVLLLLDALKDLTESGLEFRCDIVGAETSEITSSGLAREIEARCLSSFVQYHGKKTGEEKDGFFRGADVFVLPTSNDCFSLVLLEAMRFGLPVVTTDEGGIPDMVVDGVNGFICPKDRTEPLAECLKELLTDTALREKMGREGRKRFEEMFVLSIFEERMAGILMEAATNAHV